MTTTSPCCDAEVVLGRDVLLGVIFDACDRCGRAVTTRHVATPSLPAPRPPRIPLAERQRQILAVMAQSPARGWTFTSIRKSIPGIGGYTLYDALDALQRAGQVDRRRFTGTPRTGSGRELRYEWYLTGAAA